MKKLIIILVLTSATITGCLLPSEGEIHYYQEDPYTYHYEEPQVIVVETFTTPAGPSVILAEEPWCLYEDVPYYYDPLYCDDWGYCTWTEWYGEWYCYVTYSWDEFCGWEFYSEECI
jgi:hypothetical protein